MELNDSAEMNEPPLLAIGRQSYGLGSVENECQASSSNWPLKDCNGSNASSKNEFWHLENDSWRTFSGEMPQARAMPGSHRAKRQQCWGATSHIPNNLDEQGPGPSRTHLGCEADFGQGLQTELFGYCEATSSGTTGFDFLQTGLDVAGSSSSSLALPSLIPGTGSRQAAATGTGSWSGYAGSQTDLSPPIACFTGGDWKTTRDLMSNSVGQSAENIKGKSSDHLNTSAAGGVGDGGCSDVSVFPNPLSPSEGEGGKPFLQSGGFAGSSTAYSGNSRSDHVHGDTRGAYKRKMSTVDFADGPAFDPHIAARRENVAARTGGTGTNRSDPNGFANSNATSNPSLIQIWDDSHNDCTGYVGNDNDYFQSLRGGSEKASTLIRTGEDAPRSLQDQPFSMPQEPSHSQLHSLFPRNLRRSAHSHTSTRREPDVFGGNAASSTGVLPDIDHWPAMFGERSSAPPVLANWGVNSGSRRGNSAFSSPGSRERGGSNVVFEGSRVRSMPGRGPDWAAAVAMENRLANQTSTSGGVAGPIGREMNPPDFSALTSHAANSFLNSDALSSYLSASVSNGHRVNRNPAPPAPTSTVTSHQPPFGPALEVPLPSSGQHAGRYASHSPSRGRREALLAGPVQSVLGLPFRGLHMLRADGEYRRQFLSEILTAMHHAFRSEDLEELVMLDPSIIYGGVDVHDQHSDMRLDVDNMSYEELLALEERIGNVSTGLDDEMISFCLRESKYSSLDATVAAISQESDVKCSICQEEFVEEDDLGRLDCGHGYHSVCIKQWLLQKNECPICKSPAYLKS